MPVVSLKRLNFRVAGSNGQCRHLVGLWGMAFAVAWLASSGAYAWGDQPRDATDTEAATAEFVATALNPFWRSTELREPLFFVEDAGGDRPHGKLLFIPTEVLAVKSATRDITFEPGKDFQVDLATGTISLPQGSKIPVTTQEQLYPLMTSDLPKRARKSGDRTRGIFFSEGAVYHKLQVEVTYRHAPDQWKGPVTKYAGDALPKTVAKLHGKQPVKMILFGDSIAAGGNASLVKETPPYCPSFGELTALSLESHFGSKVTFTNEAVDGMTSEHGLQLVKEGRVGPEPPDLVIIAFGMNDIYLQRDVAKYQANIRAMIEGIRANAPDTEFILVASMLQNVERGVRMDKFPLYLAALGELCGPGIALADLTSMWEALLKRKSFYDLTGNGLNHPNDFGHCVYAQTLLALLVDERK